MTTTSSEGDLLRAERALQAAQRAGDVAALDRLLHDDLVAIGPDGSRYTRDDDLNAYRSGSSVITSLVEEAVEVLNVLGTTPRDMITILQAMAQGGLLVAEIRRM